MALKAAERASVVSVAQKSAGRKRRKANKRQNPPQKSVQPMRNGQGRRRGGRRQRGGKGVATTAGNTRSFIIPIDEQVALIGGSTGFAITTFPLNPGSALSFPFASRTCQNYERYEFQNLRYEYRPSATMFANVGTQGFVGITGTMDALQAAPSSQAQAEVMLHSPVKETAEPTSLNLPKEFLLTKSMRERFFVRPNGVIPGGADPHLYDCGQVFVWTTGQLSTAQIGELRVVGSVRLSNPVLETSVNPSPQFQISSFVSGATQTFVTGTPTTSLNATAVVNGLSIVNTAGTFVPPVGNYVVTQQLQFNDNANELLTSTMDFLKNSVSVYAAGALPSTISPTSGVTHEEGNMSSTLFVSANGTDAFVQFITLTGAAGALTGRTSVVWQAV